MSSSLFLLYEFLTILLPVKDRIRSLTISVRGAIKTKQAIFIERKKRKEEKKMKNEKKI